MKSKINVRGCVRGALAIGLIAVAAPAQAQDKAAEVLAAARQAIGGDKVANLKSFTVKSRMARNIGDRQMTSDLEILVEAPDKYVRIEDITAPVARTMTTGFSGDKAIRPAGMSAGPGGMRVVMMGPGGAAPAGEPAKMTPEQEAQMNAMLLQSQRTEISRLMLGWFAAAHPALGATYTYAGEAESPDGKAHVIDVKSGDFDAKLFIDQATNLPLMLTYRGPEPRVMTMGGPGGPGGRQVGAAPHAAPAQAPAPPTAATTQAAVDARLEAMRSEPPKMADFQIYFSDWREAGGVRFPHVLQRAMGGNTVEEWEITKVAVNPKIDPKKFQQ